MIFVSITRLRIRTWRFMPSFARHTLVALGQAKRAPGFISGSILRDRRLTFWTMTLWRDQKDMRAYIASGSHLTAMPKLLDWCDEASIVHWTQDDDRPPSWATADRRMRTEGRPSKVRKPAPHHQSLGFDPPRLTRAFPIERL